MSLARRNIPKRLIGDTAALRARFRDEHPECRISTEPGSAYRSWLNAERRRHDRRLRGSDRKSKRLPGDNAVLRRAFVEAQLLEFETHFGEPITDRDRLHEFTARLAAHDRDDLGEPYSAWLTGKGIDPTTGKMTEAGLAFFRSLVEHRHEL